MLVRCPDCGRENSNMAPACVGCGRPASAGWADPSGFVNVNAGPAQPASDSVTGGQVIGVLLFLGGIAAALYFFLAFDVSVNLDGARRIVNLGLMQERQNGILMGGGAALLGVVMMVGLKRRR